MLTIEEYISKRKKEDNLNEFDLDKKVENIKICMDYIFEYYNNYLDMAELDRDMVLNNTTLKKYRKELFEYDDDIAEWLVELYDTHRTRLNRVIGNILDANELFLVMNTDAEFRSISYELYPKLIKKYPYLKTQSEMIYLFIKDYHRVKSNVKVRMPIVSDEIKHWIDDTKEKYGVDMEAFVFAYLDKFFENKDMWPRSDRKKFINDYGKEEYEYDHKKKNNLFGLDLLHTKISKKPFIRGKKQYIELLMMYYWLSDFVGDEDGYWEEYLNMVLEK